MAAAELDKMDLVARLSHQALQEYEGLQRKHETATLECRRLEEERDEAFKKLHEFQQVSQMVIEEVSAIQENLEVERACRESAEALATKLNRQNRSLKRKSMMLLSHLSPDAITEISLEDEEDEDLHPSSEVCLSPGCQTTISELRINLELTLKKKNQAVADLEAVREQLRETREELLREKHDNTVLIAETLAQKKLLRRYNRVSQCAVEEFEALQDCLDLERTLRTEAETFARAMVVEQKQLKRQSHILMQSSSPSQALQEALSQVTSLTGELEAQRLEHQKQMKQMEEQLRSGEPRRELAALRRHLEVVEEERTEYSHKCSKAEEEVKDLRFAVEELRKRLQAATNPPRAPAPPPPPPPPPPPAPLTSNPLSSLLSLIRKKKDSGADIPLVVQDSAKTPEVGVKQQALEEMMQRIKRGVQLRPVSRPANRTGRQQAERPPSDSAFQELKGIMENFNRTRPQLKPASPAANGDDELQRILLRRRDALESQRAPPIFLNQ